MAAPPSPSLPFRQVLRRRPRALFPPWFFLCLLLLFPGATAWSEVTVEFVLDGSGSMWGQMYGQYKTVILKEGVGSFLEDPPEGIRFGVRAFGLPGGEGCGNTRLLVEPSEETASECLKAVKRMNPTGQAPVIFSLRKALKDIEKFGGKKVLILVADGSDSCEKDIPAAIEKLSLSISSEEIHVIALGVDEAGERSDLKLLAAKANGTFSTASNRTQLRRSIGRIVSKAVQEEERRLRLLAEEQARMAALADRTRLIVDFVGDIPGFFCTGIRLQELVLDGTPLSGIPDREAPCSGRIRIFDEPISRGEHTISLTYGKHNHGDVTRSRPQVFHLEVEAGKATRVECRTSGHLFYWGLDCTAVVETVPEPAAAETAGPE